LRRPSAPLRLSDVSAMKAVARQTKMATDYRIMPNAACTDPSKSDTDGDGYVDGLEVKNGYSPRHGEKARLVNVDSDKDYLNDAWEVSLGTGIDNADSDGDLYLDGTEVAASYDPLDPTRKKLEKRIEVRRKDLRLAYYFDDVKLADIPVSTGKRSTPTPLGDFKVLDKVPVKRYRGATYDFPNTKWNLWFTTGTGRYYIHGAYWHDKFGVAAVSAGCVNVRYEDMGRLYWFAQHGTPVSIRD
jgi:lipoprotein-anchoring transpeptidase ErfK/SrfK